MHFSGVSYFSLVCICAIAALVRAQQPIGRELFEHLLTMVTPECRAMMEEAAMSGESGVELSDSCKAEVQQALQYIAADQGFGAPEDVAEEVAPSGSATTTIVVVLVFLALLFAGAGAFVYYVYSERKDFFKEKPEKKLSKQKQLKKRMQENRKQK